jgi:hypothetical protein
VDLVRGRRGACLPRPGKDPAAGARREAKNRPSATPISVSAGGYADLDGMTINILLGIFLGLVFCLVFEFVAHSFLLKLKE